MPAQGATGAPGRAAGPVPQVSIVASASGGSACRTSSSGLRARNLPHRRWRTLPEHRLRPLAESRRLKGGAGRCCGARLTPRTGRRSGTMEGWLNCPARWPGGRDTTRVRLAQRGGCRCTLCPKWAMGRWAGAGLGLEKGQPRGLRAPRRCLITTEASGPAGLRWRYSDDGLV